MLKITGNKAVRFFKFCNGAFIQSLFEFSLSPIEVVWCGRFIALRRLCLTQSVGEQVTGQRQYQAR